MSIINLLPEDYVQRRAQQRANVMCIALFVIVMAGVGAAAVVSERNTHNTELVRDQVNAAYDEAARTLHQMQQLEAQKRMMTHKAEATSVLLERVPRSYVLAVITQALPENASLTSFDLVPRRVIKAAAPAAGKTKFAAVTGAVADNGSVTVVEVTGLAATDVQVARFIANLLRNPLLTSVDLGYSQEKQVDKISVREFRVRMELRNGVDVIDLAKAEKRSTLAAAPADDGGKL